MARNKTCVHDREYQDSFAVNHENNRGPIIMPKGSWCFACDGKGKNASWQPARGLTYNELTKMRREYLSEVDGQPLPSLALPRRMEYRTWAATMPIVIDPEDIKAAEEVSRIVADELYTALADDFDAQYSSYLGESFAETQAINRIERAKMGFKRATYNVPRYTRQVELKFEPPITSMPTLDYSVFPPRVTRERPNRTLVIELEMPADQERVLFITDEQEMKDFENFRKLKDVAARIKKVNAEIDAHEASAQRAQSAASRAYEEKARLRQEQKDLTLKAGV